MAASKLRPCFASRAHCGSPCSNRQTRGVMLALLAFKDSLSSIFSPLMLLSQLRKGVEGVFASLLILIGDSAHCPRNGLKKLLDRVLNVSD